MLFQLVQLKHLLTLLQEVPSAVGVLSHQPCLKLPHSALCQFVLYLNLPHILLLQCFLLLRVASLAMMTRLRCCSFNCRGWNSGVHTLNNFINSLDVCSVQEHWLLNDQLHKILEISTDFLSVDVSGMDNSELLLGRPFSGCAILHRKCLASFISSLETSFCAVKFCDSTILPC